MTTVIISKSQHRQYLNSNYQQFSAATVPQQYLSDSTVKDDSNYQYLSATTKIISNNSNNNSKYQ